MDDRESDNRISNRHKLIIGSTTYRSLLPNSGPLDSTAERQQRETTKTAAVAVERHMLWSRSDELRSAAAMTGESQTILYIVLAYDSFVTKNEDERDAAVCFVMYLVFSLSSGNFSLMKNERYKIATM